MKLGDRMHYIKYLLNHWRRLLIFLIILIIFVLLILFGAEIEPVSKNFGDGEQLIIIFGITLQNWGTMLAIIGTIITLLWAIYEYDKRRSIMQQEKAAEIANIFSTEIVEKLSIIGDVLTSNKIISDGLKKVNQRYISRFDIYEMKEILSKHKSIKNTDNFIENILNEIKSSKMQEEYEKLLDIVYSEEEKKRFPKKFLMLVQITLNRLEFVCMNISSNAAGSQFIYQSLHQIFLQTIHVLYFWISYKNDDGIDKYNTNIIAVYNIWNKEREKRIKQHNKTTLKVEKLRQKAEKEVKKLLHIKSETV